MAVVVPGGNRVGYYVRIGLPRTKTSGRIESIYLPAFLFGTTIRCGSLRAAYDLRRPP